MTTWNVAPAAVIGVLVAAGSLVAAPVARADCNPFEGCWGAIAASSSIQNVELVTNHEDQHHAESDAVLWCDVTGKVNDCQVVVSGMGCLSVAMVGHVLPYFGRVAPTQDAADSAALDDAGSGATILAHGCNG
jgi:hypothetical protein